MRFACSLHEHTETEQGTWYLRNPQARCFILLRCSGGHIYATSHATTPQSDPIYRLSCDVSHPSATI